MRKSRAKEAKTYISRAAIQPNSIHAYYVPINGFEYGHRFKANQVNLEANEHNGIISAKAASRIEKAVSWLLFMSKQKRVFDVESQRNFWFKINFITLTLPSPQVHSDQEIKAKALNSFIQVLRKQVGLINYLWRAEAQGNGNIHFHLVTDKYIFYKNIRRWWNQVLEPLGYIDTYQKNFGNRNPNSTDVHSVKHVKRLASYLSKYMAKTRAFACIGEVRELKGQRFEILYGSREYKQEEGGKKVGKVVGHVLGGLIRPIEGRLWYCSSSLSKVKSLVIDETQFEWAALDEVLRSTSLKRYSGEFVQSFYGDIEQEFQQVGKGLPQLLRKHTENISSVKTI